MEINDIERFKQELMNAYNRRGAQYDAEPEEIQATDPGVPDDTAYDTPSDPDSSTRYPEPDLSGLDTDTGTLTSEDDVPPEYADMAAIGSSVGYIQAYVRTGDESLPVIGAAVAVTALVDGQRMMIASGVTDENGSAPRFAVPAPAREGSQAPGSAVRPYSLFDVSVSADGFFGTRSVDVPVFAGVTSVQNFSMIPLPLMMEPSDETVTYYNQEPRF